MAGHLWVLPARKYHHLNDLAVEVVYQDVDSELGTKSTKALELLAHCCDDFVILFASVGTAEALSIF
jgi:hypothetical protein